MDFKEYQEATRLTDLGTSAQDRLNPGWLYYVLGIAGETGELMEKIKKLFRDRKGVVDHEFKEMIIKEMGDYHWYSARLCDHLGIDYNQVPMRNIEKLKDRKKRGKLHGDGDER